MFVLPLDLHKRKHSIVEQNPNKRQFHKDLIYQFLKMYQNDTFTFTKPLYTFRNDMMNHFCVCLNSYFKVRTRNYKDNTT